MAVGYFLTNSYKLETLTEQWSNGTWKIAVVSGHGIRNGPPPTGMRLDDVSCPKVNACTAVGSSSTISFRNVTLAETWTGKSWSIDSTPNPAGATFSDLTGVSCVKTTDCISVGNSSATTVSVTLAEGEHG
jgi:hypothetical protein